MPAPAGENQGTILVVDDDVFVRELAAKNLAALGYGVFEAEDGAKALELFAREAPDLILLDIMMPGKDGYAVCREIKASPLGQDIAVVLFTAHGDLDSHKKAIAAGADD